MRANTGVAAAAAAAGTLLPALAQAEILWDGRFNGINSSAALEEWDWSNPVGPYQYYIHGDGPVEEYVNLSPDFKNPADDESAQGAKITLTDTSYWNGQDMRRTELIPQTDATINAGLLYYHFSLKRGGENPPAPTREHQIAFFESHFVELKSGWQSGDPGEADESLRWVVGGETLWSADWEADVWHNVAFQIDFDAGSVGFWHSVGGDPLELVVQPVSASAESDGQDWHVGVLELPREGYADEVEDIYFSGVYIDNEAPSGL